MLGMPQKFQFRMLPYTSLKQKIILSLSIGRIAPGGQKQTGSMLILETTSEPPKRRELRPFFLSHLQTTHTFELHYLCITGHTYIWAEQHEQSKLCRESLNLGADFGGASMNHADSSMPKGFNIPQQA